MTELSFFCPKIKKNGKRNNLARKLLINISMKETSERIRDESIHIM